MTRPAGLAVVGYGLTLVGFIQVAVTIAPHIADTIPAAGGAAPAIGAAVALAIDVCWAALGHTTIHTYRNGQTRAACGFGAATALAVVASTVLLAAVGHMGPWSAVPILAALLLVADGIREHVSVSPETAAIIRAQTAEIRDQRALARIEAKRAAHTETITGFQEGTRLAARTLALAEIRTTVQRAEHDAVRQIETSQRRYGETASRLDRPTVPPETPVPSRVPSPVSVSRETPKLSVVSTETLDERDAEIMRLVGEGKTGGEIASHLTIPRSTVYRRIKALTA